MNSSEGYKEENASAIKDELDELDDQEDVQVSREHGEVMASCLNVSKTTK